MKNEKQESPAAEILWLRGLRAFVAENSTERLLADAVVAEGQSAGLDEYAVFQGEGGVEHIHFNGSVAEYTPFHGQRFEFGPTGARFRPERPVPPDEGPRR